MIKRFLMFLIFFLYLGCTENENITINLISEHINKEFSLLEKIDDLEYIPINESQPISGDIVDLIVMDSFFVVNTYGRNKLYRIKKDGNLNSKPLKYSEEIPNPIGMDGPIFDVAFNSESKIAYISDQGMNIFEVDLEKWYVTNQKSNLFGHNMYYYNKELLLNNFEGNHAIQVINPNTTNIVRNLVKRNNYSGIVAGGNPFIELDEELLFIQSKSDTIYSIKNGQATAKYSIQNGVGDYANKEIDVNQIILNYIMQRPISDKNYQILIPTSINSKLCNYLIISLFGDKRQLWVDINTNKSNIATPANIIFGHLLFSYSVPKILSFQGGYYYSTTFFDSDFKENAKNYLNSTSVENQPYNSIKELMENYKDRDYLENPIIVKFKIKGEFSI